MHQNSLRSKDSWQGDHVNPIYSVCVCSQLGRRPGRDKFSHLILIKLAAQPMVVLMRIQLYNSLLGGCITAVYCSLYDLLSLCSIVNPPVNPSLPLITLVRVSFHARQWFSFYMIKTSHTLVSGHNKAEKGMQAVR